MSRSLEMFDGFEENLVFDGFSMIFHHFHSISHDFLVMGVSHIFEKERQNSHKSMEMMKIIGNPMEMIKNHKKPSFLQNHHKPLQEL